MSTTVFETNEITDHHLHTAWLGVHMSVSWSDNLAYTECDVQEEILRLPVIDFNFHSSNIFFLALMFEKLIVNSSIS